jgi:UDP-3-O-[3-hydroxymyristoyl] glucosamine N-acyltransferase
VHIGAFCRIAGHAIIASETNVGDHVSIGGDSSIANNLSFGDEVFIVGKSAVADDIPKGEKVMGVPAISKAKRLKIIAIEKRLPEMWNTIKNLDKIVRGMARKRSNP